MFLPYSDTKHPISEVPLAVWTIIGINVVVFAFSVIHGLHESISMFGLISARPTISTLFTSMFMHASIGHLLGNMWFLWIFGDNIEKNLGTARFLFFYILTGLFATFSFTLVGGRIYIPLVGASGAISGIMGAYLRLYPSNKIKTFAMQGRPVSMRAWAGLWLVMQFFYFFANYGQSAGGVAFMAHIGGFISGYICVGFIRKKDPIVKHYYQDKNKLKP